MKKILFLCLVLGSIIMYSCSENSNATKPTTAEVEKPTVPESTLPGEITASVTAIAVTDMQVEDVEGECSGKGHKQVRYSIALKTDQDAEKTHGLQVYVWDCGDTEISSEAIKNYKNLMDAKEADLEVILQRRDNAYYPTALQTTEKIIPAKEGKIAKLQPSVSLWKE